MATEEQEQSTDEAEAGQPKLNLEVKIDKPSACERHFTVTIAREDVDRYLDRAYVDMMPKAVVPGFRHGRAPRKLVENRFKKEVAEQVKGSLLMDSLGQVSSEQDIVAISEPELNLSAVELPDEGPMTFEFDLEVRPEFDMPEWRGLKIRRPVADFTDAQIEQRLNQILSRYAQLVPDDAPAKEGSYVVVNITTWHDGVQIASRNEVTIPVRKELSFSDGTLAGFDKLMTGAKTGETKFGQLELTEDASNESLRGKNVEVRLEVLDVKRLDLPELTPSFLEEMGGFDSKDALLKTIKQDLERKLQFRQHREARQQITELLTESAGWDLPPKLLRRQSARELERLVLELRRSGFSENEIQASSNQLRQNSAAGTAKALKEHFILERIAEDETIEAEDSDYDAEIALIAAQSGESARRVRAQLEKRGLIDTLRNQIVERKVIECVLKDATFTDVADKADELESAAIDFSAGGEPPVTQEESAVEA